MSTSTAPTIQHNALLEPGDIFFTRGQGLFARLIRRFTRTVGEERTKVNHVGLVVGGGWIETAVVIEALSKVKRHQMARYVRKQTTEVAIYRPKDLTEEQLAIAVAKAEEYKDQKYGWVKIVAHFLDWTLQGAYVFRRFTRDDQYPICSWVVAYAFEKARREYFDINPGRADPDDIWDCVTDTTTGRFEEVRSLAPLTP